METAEDYYKHGMATYQNNPVEAFSCLVKAHTMGLEEKTIPFFIQAEKDKTHPFHSYMTHFLSRKLLPYDHHPPQVIEARNTISKPIDFVISLIKKEEANAPNQLCLGMIYALAGDVLTAWEYFIKVLETGDKDLMLYYYYLVVATTCMDEENGSKYTPIAFQLAQDCLLGKFPPTEAGRTNAHQLHYGGMIFKSLGFPDKAKQCFEQGDSLFSLYQLLELTDPKETTAREKLAKIIVAKELVDGRNAYYVRQHNQLLALPFTAEKYLELFTEQAQLREMEKLPQAIQTVRAHMSEREQAWLRIDNFEAFTPFLKVWKVYPKPMDYWFFGYEPS